MQLRSTVLPFRRNCAVERSHDIPRLSNTSSLTAPTTHFPYVYRSSLHEAAGEDVCFCLPPLSFPSGPEPNAQATTQSTHDDLKMHLSPKAPEMCVYRWCRQMNKYLALLLHELADHRLGLTHLCHGERANLCAQMPRVSRRRSSHFHFHSSLEKPHHTLR